MPLELRTLVFTRPQFGSSTEVTIYNRSVSLNQNVPNSIHDVSYTLPLTYFLLSPSRYSLRRSPAEGLRFVSNVFLSRTPPA